MIKPYFLRTKKAQSTVEYILLFAAVIAVAIIFLRPNGTFQGALESTLNSAANGMDVMANRLGNSRPDDPRN